MLTELLQRISLFRLLRTIDSDLAQKTRQQRCPYCGGHLHHSNYARKPRGGPTTIPEEYLIRESLCCGREGCRKRTLPPSCLFMGRRVSGLLIRERDFQSVIDSFHSSNWVVSVPSRIF